MIFAVYVSIFVAAPCKKNSQWPHIFFYRLNYLNLCKSHSIVYYMELFSNLWLLEGNGNPVQCSCLANPRDGGAWWAAVYGVTQSQTRLKWLSSSSSSSIVILLNLKIRIYRHFEFCLCDSQTFIRFGGKVMTTINFKYFLSKFYQKLCLLLYMNHLIFKPSKLNCFIFCL